MVCGRASHNYHPHPCYNLKFKELQVNVKLLFPSPSHKNVWKMLAIVWPKPNFPLLSLERVVKVGGWPPLLQTFKLAYDKCYFHVLREPRLDPDPNHMRKVQYFFEGLKKFIQMKHISSIIWTISCFLCSIIIFVRWSFTLFNHKVNPFVCMFSCLILLMVLGIDLVEHNIGCDVIE
jgi:hypothetical protein